MLTVDINCDMGESWHDNIVGQDELLMPLITSCNLACGVHGGDDYTMDKAIALAIEHKVAIGAHPSLPNRLNFGREAVDLAPERLKHLVFSQLEKLCNAAVKQGQQLQHIKPHGALYHLAIQRQKEASIIIAAAKAFDIQMIYGWPNSLLQNLSEAASLQFVPEGFVDRAYENASSLRSRQLEGAILHDPSHVARQAYDLTINHCVKDQKGNKHTIEVKTLCIHGDHQESLDNLAAIRSVLSPVVQIASPVFLDSSR